MDNDLIGAATEARLHSLSPYSGFKVGAALETTDGRIFTGCNIETASYGLTVCAERVALWKALSEGAREFRHLAVVTGARVPAPPCGACRQLLWEHCGDLTVILHSLGGAERAVRMSELLPEPFDRRNMEG
jgi:cytidine deaminase